MEELGLDKELVMSEEIFIHYHLYLQLPTRNPIPTTSESISSQNYNSNDETQKESLKFLEMKQHIWCKYWIK
jgi:hypothetical protein